MLSAREVLERTNGGKDIFNYLWPEHRAHFEKRNSMFRLRDEKTPSANYFYKNDRWFVNDHGGDDGAMDAIKAWQREHRCTYAEAMDEICRAFGLADTLDARKNVSAYKAEPMADKPDGHREWRKREWNEDDIRLLCPHGTYETLASLGWIPLERIGVVKNGTMHWSVNTDYCPIYMRECRTDKEPFYKIYQPRTADKARRFQYFPAGSKPTGYINGLKEIQEAFKATRTNEEEQQTKLPAAVICSGERDALCCKAFGYYPIWFNSETYNLTQQEFESIIRYVEDIYNIPDLDATGVRRGSMLALRFRKIKTVWLPKELSERCDHRGKPKKDLRDWCDIKRTAKEFTNLLRGSLNADFIIECPRDKGGKERYAVLPSRMLEFLKLHGFYTLADSQTAEARFIRINGFTVTEIYPRDIAGFIMGWARKHNLSEAMKDAIMNTSHLTPTKLEKLDEIRPDFTSYGIDYQLFYAKDKCYKVTAESIEEYTERNNFVWDKTVIDHEVRKLGDMFEVYRAEEGKYRWRINIKDTSSPFFCYLINTARIYWRKEFEEQFTGNGKEKEQQEYKATHQFCIDGECLTPLEKSIQMQNLVNKIFTIGYLCHKFKMDSRSWAPFAMDNKIGEDGQCNGGSGKTVFFKIMANYINAVMMNGKDKDPTSDKHLFEQVSSETDLVFFDDCERSLRIKDFYSVITGDMTINVKNKSKYTLKFADSPKFAFNTNYVLDETSDSTDRRLLYLVFSDYYHTANDRNDYLETRTVHSDFGRDLYAVDYPEKDWEADMNFIMQCTRFYLWAIKANGAVRLLPPMDDIYSRQYKQAMGEAFELWATKYFAEDSDHIDCNVSRAIALENFRMDAKLQKVTTQSFTARLKAFVGFCPWIEMMNPDWTLNQSGRNLQRINGEVVECIYLKSTRNTQDARQQSLPFATTNDNPPIPPF